MDFIQLILPFIATGGPTAIIVILFAVIVILIWDRKNLSGTLESTIQKVYDAKDAETKSIREIINQYHQGNLDLIQALNEIKIVLSTIQNSRGS